MSKTIEQKFADGREYRNLAKVEAREENEESYVVEGYATTFEQEYTLWEEENYIVREVVDKDAFKNCDLTDVIMQYNHEGRVFARIRNNTLTVEPDEYGLKIRADLGGTEGGRELFDEIRGGYTDKMSFGFIVRKDSVTETEEDGGKTIILRRILDVKKVFDVSAVSIPANDTTEITARNFAVGAIRKAETERLTRENLKKKREALALRCRLLCGKED